MVLHIGQRNVKGELKYDSQENLDVKNGQR